MAAGRERAVQVAARPAAAVTRQADGLATIETYTVRYDWPVRTGIVIGRLEADDSRFMALVDDPELLSLLSDGEPFGARIAVRPRDEANYASV